MDKRSDIWAFGCVLYEMLTGKRAFEDEDVSMTLSKVLQREPDFDALPPTCPPRVRQTLRVCLRKDHRSNARGHSRRAAGAGGRIRDERCPRRPHRPPGRRAPLEAAPFLLAARRRRESSMTGPAAWTLRPTPPPTVTRFPLALPEGQQFRVTVEPHGRLP